MHVQCGELKSDIVENTVDTVDNTVDNTVDITLDISTATLKVSRGQRASPPPHLSSRSHSPLAGRHTVSCHNVISTVCLQYLHRISTVSTQYIYLATISTLLRVAAWPRPALRPRHEAAGGGVAARGGGVALLARLSEPVTAHGTLEYL